MKNTLDRDSKLSPAKALYERELRDFLPRRVSALIWDMWMKLDDDRETAPARRAKHSEKKWSEQMRALAPLKVGDTVILLNRIFFRFKKNLTLTNADNHEICLTFF